MPAQTPTKPPAEQKASTPQPQDIHQALLEVYRQVGYVQKTKPQGSQLNYTFAGESALIAAVRPAMVDAGVTMSVSSIEDMKIESLTNQNQKVFFHVTLRMVVQFTHAKSKTSVLVQSVGEASDFGDKATLKATTAAFKYALRQTFCIETGDDPDEQPSEDFQTHGTQAPEKAPSKTPPPEKAPAQPEAPAPKAAKAPEAPAPEDVAGKPALDAWKNLVARAIELGIAVPNVKIPVSKTVLKGYYTELFAKVQELEEGGN